MNRFLVLGISGVSIKEAIDAPAFDLKDIFEEAVLNYNYRKVASIDTFCIKAHPGIFRLLMKEKFDADVL
jgi:hypothetical protein